MATEHRLRQGSCRGKIAIEVIESRSGGGHRAGPNLEVFELGHVRSGIGATILAVTEESDTRGLGINGASSCQALEGGGGCEADHWLLGEARMERERRELEREKMRIRA